MYDYNEIELLADGLRASYRSVMALAKRPALTELYSERMAELETLYAKLYEGNMTGRFTIAEFWARVDELEVLEAVRQLTNN
jgi:hypothetical protein